MKVEGKSIYSISHELTPLMSGDLYVCLATHPTQPNYSGNSRGRKVHLSKDQSKTVCNMLVSELVPKEEGFEGGLWQPVNNGKCKVCFNS